jgi:hypothetical protein
MIVKGELVLVKDSYAFSLPLGNLTPISLKLTCQNLQKGGFAGAVGTDQAVAVSRGKLDIRP